MEPEATVPEDELDEVEVVWSPVWRFLNEACPSACNG